LSLALLKTKNKPSSAVRLFAQILCLCYKVLERLPIVATKTLQALLNQKSKGCLKKHSLSLESQRSQIATHNPKKVGYSSLDTLSLLTKHPIAMPI
jgi:hypothetical protein